MTNENDDKPKNNEIIWGIGVDNTPPKSTHTIEPAIPDGDNGWYVSDSEVTIYAHDPSIGCGYPGSGVKEIKFKIGGGSTQTFTQKEGSFIVDVDADNLIIEYWAVDWVGNAETHHTFTIDMDQTDPIIDMVYEWQDGPNGPGKAPWLMIFNATCSDATSGMNRVRFLLNGVEQEVVVGPGPVFTWSFLYSGGLDITITAETYDNAGNMVIEKIVDPENINVNIKQYQSTKILQITQKHLS
jgi:hypothetical protein